MWKHYFINSALFYIAGYVCLDITYLSALSFLYLFREKQEDLEHCCDILRNNLTLILTMQGMITFLFQIANKRSSYCIDYRHNRLWNSATSPKMQNLIQNDVVLCYFQIGVEQSIILCKKKSSWISSIALKRNKENWLAELGEQSDLLAFKVVVVVVVVVGWGEGVGISVTSVCGSVLLCWRNLRCLIPFTVNLSP